MESANSKSCVFFNWEREMGVGIWKDSFLSALLVREREREALKSMICFSVRVRSENPRAKRKSWCQLSKRPEKELIVNVALEL